MSTVLVSGGAGFIGSHLCEHLLESGYSVRVLDNFSNSKEENVAHLNNRLKLIRGDITNYNDLSIALSGCDIVVHLAAIVSVARSFKDPTLVHNTNVLGTLMFLREAEKAGVKKFIFASSCAVYGNNAAILSENIPLSPLSPYALSKYIGEQYTLLFNKTNTMNSIALRFFNVFGQRQDAGSPYSGVIASFTNKMFLGESPVIYGDGEQTRDFIFVGDVSRAIIKVIMTENISDHIINIATGTSRTINNVLASIGDILGVVPSIVYSEPREGDIRYSQADISSLQEKIQYKASTPFNEGLKRTIEWYDNQRRVVHQGGVL